ncbi:MAG TPA: GNAT family N-acetyltransferase [Ktedonobacteraceae bacterium]|nr:GNAT family N-acetyltransferase [Ktedonobacteraceae bacterium]
MRELPLPSIECVSHEEAIAAFPDLIHLLQDTVASGASVGFLPPLSTEEAQRYWQTVFQEVAQKVCVLLVAREAGQIVGSVQLALALKPNAQHRAEVQKLFVLSSQRRRGIGQALMHAVERAARDCGRTLLVLDTRQGDNAERLYRRLGYCEAGVIPAYARSANGTLDSTVIFYKIFQEGESGIR